MPLDRTVPTTSHPAELASALEDAQESLKIYAAKVELLSKELADAHNALAAAGIGPRATEAPAEGEERPPPEGDERSPPPLPPKAPPPVASPASARGALRMISTASMRRSGSTGSMHRVSSTASMRGQLPTQQPLYFYHGDRKVCVGVGGSVTRARHA